MFADALSGACTHLSRVDPVMRRLMRQVGQCGLHPQGARYSVLVRSILSQQISVHAAQTIRRRLQRLLPSRHISARNIGTLSDQQLQAAGISRQKRLYLSHLTELTLDGTLNFRSLATTPNDEDIISTLVQVKGVGRWTAQMFLLFGLGRLDIFAANDLGLRKAIATHYDLPATPTYQDYDGVSQQWIPFRSVASWYLWRSLDT